MRIPYIKKMKQKFIQSILVIFFIIAATEGLRDFVTNSYTIKQKVLTSHNLFRQPLRSFATLETEKEVTISNKDSRSFNTRRTNITGRKNVPNRNNIVNILINPLQHQSIKSSWVKVIEKDNLGNLKVPLEKSFNHRSMPFISQKVLSEPNSEKLKKNRVPDNKDNNTNYNDKRYLPDILNMKYVRQESIVNPIGKTDHQFVKFQNNKLTLKVENIDNKFNLTTGSDKYNRSSNHQQKNVIELSYDHDIAASSSENVHINTTSIRLNTARRSHNISSFTQIPNILNNQDIREAAEDKQIFQRVIYHNNSKVINNNVSVRGGSRIEKNKKINVMINNNDISIQPNYHTRNLNSKAMPGNSEHTKILEIQTGSQNIKKLNSSRNRHKIDVTNNGTSNQTSPISTISELIPKTRNIQRAKAVSTITPTFKSITLPFVTSRTILKSTSSQRSTVNVEMKRNIYVGKTSRQNNQSRRASKEDFFNRGLGFRGRRPSISRTEQVPAIITSTTTTPISAITFKTENTGHGNPGWTLRRRPGHWRTNSSSPVIFNSVEIPTLVQTNKINSTEVSISKTMRRGNKTFAKITDGRIKEEFSEIDNYPPEFKARISQLQKTDIHMRSSLDVNKMTALELFATRSKIKLDNARKLVKPELLVDETNTHQEIVNPLSKYIHIRDQNIRKLKDNEDQNTLKNMQKLTLFTERSRWYQTTSMKANWETSKLKKDLQDSQTRFARYKQTQLYTVNSKIPSNNIISTIEKSTDKNIYKNKATNSTQLDQYQEHKYKLISKLPENKFRGPKSSQIEDKYQDNLFPTTKLSIIIKPRKILGLSKNDKSYVEDVKVLALKFRKTLESIEKSQIHKLVKKSDSMDGPTTLLTTMRTIKSFSFSTRLAKMDNTNSISSSTMKIFENQMPPALILSSTFPSFDTKTVMQNFTEHEMATSAYNNILTVHDSLSLKTNNFFTKKAHAKGEIKSDWNVYNNAVNSTISHDKSSAAALVNDTDSTVFVVYPSAIEKPLSIAITPKSFENQTTVEPEGALLSQQLSVTQKPIINETVWSSNDSNSTTFLQESLPNLQNIIFGNTKSTNIFNPSKSTAIFKTGNNTILEYLRSTVAPLWSTRGFQSPAVSNIYKNSNSVNSLSRLISNSALSKFSARYKGTELYLRRPTPTNFYLSQHNDSTTQINVMNAENSQTSTLYQSTNVTNNEKTDIPMVTSSTLPDRHIIDSYQSKDEYQHDRINENKGQRNSVSLQQDGSNIQNLTASVRPVKNMIEIFNPISSTINSLIDTPKKTTRATIISVPKIESPTIPATTRVMTPTELSPIMENLKTTITEASVMRHTPIISSEELFSTIESPVTLNPNAFGNTFDDLAFLNTLLENPSLNESTPKTLTKIEQLLANKILSLVLGRTLTNSASFRSPKAIQLSNASPNSYQMNTARIMAKMSSSLLSSSSQPTVIGLVPLSTTKLPGIESTMPYTWKPIRTFSGYKQSSVISMETVTPSTMPMSSMTTSRIPKMSKSLNLHFTSTSKTLQSMLGHLKTMTTSASAILNNMPKTTKRFKPSTTSKVPLSAPLAFATNFLRTIFGSNPFALTTTRPMIKKSASTLKTLSPTAQNITTVASRSTVISIESVEPQNNSKSIHTSPNVLTNIQSQTDTIYNTVSAKEMTIVTPMPTITEQSPAIYSSKDDTKFLSTFLQITQNMNGSNNEPAMKSQFDDQIIEPSTPINLLNEQLQQSIVGKAIQSSTTRATTISTRTTTKWRSSSWTYPSLLFGNFDGLSNGSSLYQDKGLVRNQVLNAAISMTQRFGKFLGATITGAAQQFQWFIRNGTRWG